MNDQAHPEYVTVLVRRLVHAVRERGLSADPFGGSMAWVANRVADPPDGVTAPGMRQAVLCRPDREGRMAWWWIWTGRDGSPEYEGLCPADDITAAADAIARVLALRPLPVERTGR
jgi:hypothetical protein